MNYYERVQKAIDYIEANLKQEEELEVYARQAFMSISNFYRLFYAFVGQSVKKYIRLRRLSCAAIELKHRNLKVIDVSMDYCFESPEAFTRAFKQQFGISPMQYKKGERAVSLFERIDLMEKYFDNTEAELNKYPDIKIIKNLPAMKVAYYRGKGYNAELDAFNTLMEHAKAKGILKDFSNHRIFGFDNLKLAEDHEYEVWITVDENVCGDEVMGVKEFEGGKYAVMSTTVKEIEAAWKRFSHWLSQSKHAMGQHQWLEEHLLSDGSIDEDTRIDLYLPVTERLSESDDVKEAAYEGMQPEIMEFGGFRLIGEKCLTSVEDNARNSTCKKLWDRFNKAGRRIRGVSDSAGAYGIVKSIDATGNPGGYSYMAGLRVNTEAVVPGGFEELTVEKGLYARFTYQSSLRTGLNFEDVGKLYKYVYHRWLPESQYSYNPEKPEIEYLETAGLRKEYPQYDIYIPIKGK